MSPKKLLVLTGIVALLVAFIALFERKMPSTAERQRKGDLYWDIPPDRLERIQLVRGAETLDLQKTGTNWRLTKPDSYPADTFAVSSLATELAQLKRSGEEIEGRPADYGLDPPSIKATIVWTVASDPKSKQTRTIEFGKEVPGTDVAAARVAGASRVMFVPTSTLSAVKKGVDDFRSREIFGNLAGEVARLEILRGRGRLELNRKDGVWWLAQPIADLAESAEADRLVGQLTGLRARDFIHGAQDLATLGLNPPLFHVTVAGSKGETTTADFGSTRTDGNTVYGRHEGQVLTVEGEIVEELSKEAVAFRSTALVAFNRSDVSAVDGAFGRAAVSLAQKDGGWSSQGRPVLAAAVDDLLTAILDLKSKSFLDDAELKDLPSAAATITIRQKSGSPWTITLVRRSDRVVARVSSRPGGFALDADAPGKIQAAFEKASAPAVTPTAAKPMKPTVPSKR
jgi:hypothetical protein